MTAVEAFIEEATALVTDGGSFGVFDRFLGLTAALIAEEFGASLVDAAGPVREAAARTLRKDRATDLAFAHLVEALAGLVAERLGDGPGDQPAAEAVYDACNLAAGARLWPEGGPVDPGPDPGLTGWVR